MRVASVSCVVVFCCALTNLGCDRVQALKDQLLGSKTPEDQGNPALETIENLYEAGQYASALQSIDAALQDDPSLVEAMYYRGLCHLAMAGEPDLKAPLSQEETDSLAAFQEALAINPRHAPSAIGIGDLYRRRVPARRRRGDEDPESPYSLARAAYEKAVTIDPKLPEAQLHYARFLERVGDLDGAEQAYRKAAEAAATVPEIAPDYYLAYGRFLAGPADRLDEAVDQFELARVFRQDDEAIQQELAIVHSRLGIRHFENEEYMLAEEGLKNADALFPDHSIPEAQKNSETLEKLRSIRRR
jgi:tetratricopeptide (TPR) repeat protein